MTSALLRSGKSFLRWYWNRVKEVPVVVGSFAAGGITVAVLIQAPGVAQLVYALALRRIT